LFPHRVLAWQGQNRDYSEGIIMGLGKVFFLVGMIFASANIFAQDISFPKIMYVTAEDGLRIRAEPPLSGSRLDSLLFGSRIAVVDRKNQTTIDGITDYWYRIDSHHEKWVLGGYISGNFPENAILGRWDDPRDPRKYYYFSSDSHYAEGYKGTDMGFHGTWSLDGNNIILHLTGAGYDTEFDETVEVQLTVIDINNIKLTFPENRTVALTRSHDSWW